MSQQGMGQRDTQRQRILLILMSLQILASLHRLLYSKIYVLPYERPSAPVQATVRLAQHGPPGHAQRVRANAHDLP